MMITRKPRGCDVGHQTGPGPPPKSLSRCSVFGVLRGYRDSPGLKLETSVAPAGVGLEVGISSVSGCHGEQQGCEADFCDHFSLFRMKGKHAVQPQPRPGTLSNSNPK